VSVDEIFFEVKTEADSNDTTECSHDDELSTGMFHFFVRIFCDDLLLQSSTTNAWSNRSGDSLCTYACICTFAMLCVCRVFLGVTML